MKTTRLASALAAAVLLALSALAPCAGAAVTLRFTPADTSVNLGATATLSVWLDEPLAVRTVEVWVDYNPAILTSLSGVKGAKFAQTGCFIWEGFEATAPNQWHGYAIVIGSTCWVTGPGELYRWTFRGDARGVSPVVSAEARLYDPQANLIADVTLAPTTVRVKDPALTPVPEAPPAAGLGLAPNPFNPRTTLTLTAATPGPARVELFDLRGRPLGTVWQGWIGSSPATVAWDGREAGGRELPGGVYLLRLRDAHGASALARAVLLK